VRQQTLRKETKAVSSNRTPKKSQSGFEQPHSKKKAKAVSSNRTPKKAKAVSSNRTPKSQA
jgi:hypothetical protein